MQPGADEIDYRETADVTSVHGAVKREHREPEAGTYPVPLWLIAVATAVTATAFFYLGQYNGGFSASVFNPLDGTKRVAKTAGPEGEGGAAAEASLAQQGEKVYKSNCVQCHQANGMGTKDYPSLVGSEWVNGPTKRLAMLILKGMQGPHTSGGKSYNGAMPAWGGTLNDKKIAGVISYIRSAWGNQGSEVTPEQVAAVRAEIGGRADAYTSEELAAVTENIP